MNWFVRSLSYVLFTTFWIGIWRIAHVGLGVYGAHHGPANVAAFFALAVVSAISFLWIMIFAWLENKSSPKE